MPNMKESAYRAHPSLNWSNLKHLQQSAALFAYRRANPISDTQAMRLGRAVHAMALKPEDFEVNFVVKPKFAGEGSVAERKAFEEAHTGYTILSDDDLQTCIGMTESIHAHPAAATLLDACDIREQPFFSDTNQADVKCRVDAYSTELRTLVDLKTCQDASPEAASKLIYNWWYHAQLAYYGMILQSCEQKLPVKSYVLIFVEKTEPYQVAVYSLSESAIMHGMRECVRLLNIFKECEEQCVWPGYSDEVESIDLPPWAYTKEERELIERFDYV